MTIDIQTNEAAEKIIASLGEVSQDHREMIRGAVNGLALIGVAALAAASAGDSARLAELQNQRNVLVATLLSIGEVYAVQAQHKIESFVTGLLYKAIDVVLGRLGL